MSGTERRLREAFGIVVLASAILLGPSLASVHFSDGLLMGPLGRVAGVSLNRALGLCGYLVVMWMTLLALRLFASALGQRKRPSPARWRQRLGTLLGIAFMATLLHLIGRPFRLADASIGGWLGEFSAEFVRALLSTPGAWITALSGLALSVVLATEFSWAQVLQRVGKGLVSTWTAVQTAFNRFPARVQYAGQWLAQQLTLPLAKRELAAQDGAAALPPVLRVDLSQDRAVPGELPDDLEIGQSAPVAGPRIRMHPAEVSEEEDDDEEEYEEEDDDEEEYEEEDDDEEEEYEEEDDDEEEYEEEDDDEEEYEEEDDDEEEYEEEDDDEEEEIRLKPALTIIQSRYRSAQDTDEVKDCVPEAEKNSGEGFVLSEGAYRPPPLSLLTLHGDEQRSIDEAAIQQQAARLTKSLADYKILGTVTEVHPGPVVTMYEFVPAPGTRISKIVSLSNDLAMSLHAERVRIVAPIPGKGAIGIEVPNEKREVVSFKDIVVDESFRSNQKARLALALGKNIVGAPIVVDLTKMPHLLVAGATGAGKSVSVNAMICSLLMRYSPHEVRMIMVDPKFLELSGYNEIPHLMLPVVTDPKLANLALRWAVAEMERRYQQLADMRVRDIVGYNRKVDKMRGRAGAEENGAPPLENSAVAEASPSSVTVVHKSETGDARRVTKKLETESAPPSDDPVVAESLPADPPPADPQSDIRPMPYVVVVIDEFADLMMVASKEVETSVARLAQKARACGIHLILATQRPSVDVITGLIKANFPSRIAFQVASNHDSKTILGSYGAENLLGSGDMLVLDRGADMKRVHGAYISDEEIRSIIDWLRQQGRPVYDMDILKPAEEEIETSEEDEQVDEMYDKAIALISETRQVSISMIQRRLRVGYNRAARMVERMERDGIVGPPDGVRGRQVLVQEH